MKRSMKQKISCKDVLGWLLVGISLVMLGNSIRLCFSRDIWYDELFTIGMIEHSYGDLIGFTARDVHPPFYYCITKFVIDLCKLIYAQADSIMIAKMVSVMPYFFLLAYVLTFMRKRFGIFVSGVSFFCMIAMPQMSAYTVEVRMYSLALFLVTAAFLHAYEIVGMGWNLSENGAKKGKRKLHWTALTLYGLAAAYTQYFACVAVVVVYLYVFLSFAICYIAKKESDGKKNIKNWLVSVGVCIIGYLPWLFVFVSQITTVRENYWILPLTWRNLGGCVKFLMKPAFTSDLLNTILAVLFFLLYLGVFGIFGWRIFRKYRQKEHTDNLFQCLETTDGMKFWFAAAGCMVLGGLVAFGFAASVLLRPIFVYRYMIPAAGCFWLGFAICLDAVTTDARKGFQVLQIGTALLILLVGSCNYCSFMGEEEYKIVLMKDTEKALEQISTEDIVIYNFDQLQAVTSYYVNCENYLWCGRPETLILDMFGEKGSVEDTETLKKWMEEGRNVWFLGSFNSREDICDTWEGEGILTEEKGSYMLERYWFNIYEMTIKK